jgi:beta-galactosidase
VETDGDLAGIETLVVGRRALSVDGPAPDLRQVREGLNVVVFEQTSEVLEKRLGLRVVEYGLRNVFARVPDHPVLAGLTGEHLRDWAGESTLLPARLTYQYRPQHGPTVQWCGIPVSRAWRRGNRGDVASVLIEKPGRGDFRPIVDGGFALQYSPLMEYREGKGRVVFCQLDVTGRSEEDPAARTLVGNLLRYVEGVKTEAAREVIYAGDEAGLAHLRAVGFAATKFDGQELVEAKHVLVVGPGGGKVVGDRAREFVRNGGAVLAVGLEEAELAAFLPGNVKTAKREHIAASFAPAANRSLLAGVSPADVYNRDPREAPLVSGGANVVGDGVLATVEGTNVVLCQLAPWQFAKPATNNVRRTYRRVSFLLTRMLSNLGAASSTPLLDRMARGAGGEAPYLEGLYVDRPEEWDDPYRFFRW